MAVTTGSIIMPTHEDRVGRRRALVRAKDGNAIAREDAVLEELPLSVVINGRPYAMMMGTPCHIEDFLFGFLFTEGIIQNSSDVLACEVVGAENGYAGYVQLSRRASVEAEGRARVTLGGSGCGLCGVPRFDGLISCQSSIARRDRVPAERIFAGLELMKAEQWLNQKTGTAHAAIVVGAEGSIVREDIGRHNAVDKAAGHVLRCSWNLDCLVLMGVSSRLTFEIVQKALRLHIPVVAAISGVSSMAITVAEKYGLTVIGYARDGRMTIYTHDEALALGLGRTKADHQ